jgi:NAD(P)-dependent dehydrogenase (short-subunit alcohol dehydrogenase family)
MAKASIPSLSSIINPPFSFSGSLGINLSGGSNGANMKLKDKVTLITGAGAGIGRAIALRFAREGARVVVAEIDSHKGQSTVEAIQRSEGTAIFVPTDVSGESDVKAMVASAAKRFGRIDVLVNNAAVLFHKRDARAHELTSEVWDRTHSTNLRGVWLCSKYVIPLMLEQRGGSIIHIASPTGLTGCAPGLTAYSSSKGGVIGLTRVMAVDYARENIRVNAIVPGTIDTPMNADILSDEQTRKRLIASAPSGRLGTPEDICGLAVFLASDDSLYCVGGLYMADGGLTAV